VRPEVRRASEVEEFESSERCFILEIANDVDDESVSIARARVEPGVTTDRHRLRGIAERYVVAAGLGRVEIGELAPFEVTAGDVVRIPADVPQRIANIGTEDLIFYCVCTPRFRSDSYESLESTTTG
jgi:mannose-6-phosphate isomerase-like protein (cupin superfamily)